MWDIKKTGHVFGWKTSSPVKEDGKDGNIQMSNQEKWPFVDTDTV